MTNFLVIMLWAIASREAKLPEQNSGFLGAFWRSPSPCHRLTLLAGVSVVHIFLKPEPGRFWLQAPIDFFANLLHHGAAGIADPFLFGKPVLHHFRVGPSNTTSSIIAALPFAGGAFTVTCSAVAFLVPYSNIPYSKGSPPRLGTIPNGEHSRLRPPLECSSQAEARRGRGESCDGLSVIWNVKLAFILGNRRCSPTGLPGIPGVDSPIPPETPPARW